MTIAKKLLKKFEAMDDDVVVVKVPFADIKNIRDSDDAVKMSKFIASHNELSGFKVKDVVARMDGSSQELVIEIDIKGKADHAKIKQIIKKIFN